MREFGRVLVANRGEIALRVVRALRALDIEAVAVYSDPDASALHTTRADRSFRLPGTYPTETYLNAKRIVEIATKNRCDAIHPGYGFLAESADFARLCRVNGVKFIGPSTQALAKSGNKLECKRIAESKRIPVVPYTKEPIDDGKEASRRAEEIGFPVLLKSAFGGGGRGIREARSRAEVKDAFESVRREARGAFGRAAVFIEKKLLRPRHIEVQILASEGAREVVELGERECSIQRRYQKLVEVSPSPVVDETRRSEIVRYAISIAKALGYSNAGTVEFLRDSATGRFYFLEVNARLQVEHPVTEMRTGIDLVMSQIHIARHGRLPVHQKDVQPNGTAIECRINSEDPLQGFAPATGTVENLRVPGGPGVRVDTALYEGMEVTPYYDSLLAKLISWGRSFEEARRRQLAALDEFKLAGVSTTIPFHREVIADPSFVRGDLSTSFIDESGVLKRLSRESVRASSDLFAVAALLLSKNQFRVSSAGPAPAVSGRRPPPHASGGRFVDGL